MSTGMKVQLIGFETFLELEHLPGWNGHHRFGSSSLHVSPKGPSTQL